MALIKKDEQADRVMLKAKIDKSTKETADSYCKWAGISEVNHLLNEALEYVFRSDKEWQQYCEKQKNLEEK